MQLVQKPEIFKMKDTEELTVDTLSEYISRFQNLCSKRYKILQDAYETDYPIFQQADKEKYKPDNRIAVNFAKYITDTMNGFFLGIPAKVSSGEENIDSYVNFLDRYNDQDDNNAELSKMCSVFGNAYEMYYTDENSEIGITYVSPMDGFMIYDDSVLQRPRYFVRVYVDEDGLMTGSVSDETTVKHFTCDGSIRFIDDKTHGFPGVPAVEFVENRERIGIFEPVLSMINEYNKAISEKANDVDYFADAYLKILGALIDNEGIKAIRDNRIINLEGQDTEKIVVEFLQKPSADGTQENLLDRLERLIFQISMVANISDENFGTSSGIAMAYKLQAMSNLFKTKVRKFTSGMNRRYKLIFGNPLSFSKVKVDDWVKLKYTFTPNLPKNLLEEAQIAQNLSGIVSEETQLSVLSIVDDVDEEMRKKQDEQESLKREAYQEWGVVNDEQRILAEEGTTGQTEQN